MTECSVIKLFGGWRQPARCNTSDHQGLLASTPSSKQQIQRACFVFISCTIAPCLLYFTTKPFGLTAFQQTSNTKLFCLYVLSFVVSIVNTFRQTPNTKCSTTLFGLIHVVFCVNTSWPFVLNTFRQRANTKAFTTPFGFIHIVFCIFYCVFCLLYCTTEAF